MFIGRERELASLKEFYDEDGIGRVSFREPGTVEARQTAPGFPITSELKLPK